MESTDSSSIIYAQDALIRSELTITRPSRTIGPLVTIQDCDTHELYTLSPGKREFAKSKAAPFANAKPTTGQEASSGSNETPNLVFDSTTVDTGETKIAFGHVAHRFITTTKVIASPELGMDASDTVEDAWYLDIPDTATCNRTTTSGHGWIGSGISLSRVKVIPEFRHVGPEPRGLVLSSKRTQTSTHLLQTGVQQILQSTSSHEITEITEGAIDSALFEVPPDYQQVPQVHWKD
jgi:hypothetical protein